MANEDLNIRSAFITELITLLDSGDIAFENVGFTPVVDKPYAKIDFIPLKPRNTSSGNKHYQLNGIFQVCLCFPKHIGVGESFQFANTLQQHFARGKRLEKNGCYAIVKETPTVFNSVIQENRYVIPVRIFYYSEVME